MKPKSDNLFHFTKSIETLKKILKNGIMPRYCLEDVKWMGTPNRDYMAFPMSCFCDIPLSRISEHTKFYGEYGLGLTKNWGNKNSLNPVIYSSPNGHTQKALKYFMDFYFDDEIDEEPHMQIYRLLALHKPTHGTMLIDKKSVQKEFHLENEWRYVPECEMAFLFNTTPAEKTKELNEKVEQFILSISPTDIKYIFVPHDHDIPNLVDFINNELGNHSHNDLKILQTRIISLETLRKDI